MALADRAVQAQHGGVILVLVIVVLAILVPMVLLGLRLRSGEESVRGGSFGRQYLGRNGDDDWGPKSG